MAQVEEKSAYDTSPKETQDRVSKKAKTKTKKAINKKNKVLRELKVVYVDVGDLKPNTYNPNRQSDHDFELLLKSMEEDGFTQPIVALKKNKMIVDGEHRWRAAQTLGYTAIPVVFVNMTEEQMRISTLRHNRARGQEDLGLTANVLKDLQELGAIDWAQDSLMMSDVEMDRLLEDVSAPDAMAGEEYTQSWGHDTVSDPTVAQVEKGVTTYDIDDDKAVGRHQHSVTQKAAGDIREQEKVIQEAKTQEERSMAVKKRDLFRLSLMFSGNEAKLVQEVLGDEPAQTILEMCCERIKGK